jgi:hypothetical protein
MSGRDLGDHAPSPGRPQGSPLQSRLGWFAREVLGKPLYPYQELVGDAILDSVLSRRGLTFSVMFARQMGKNQLSAVLEAYLLSCMEEGSIVKAAPTFKPQIVNSRLRLLATLDNPLTWSRVWRSYGYMIGVARSPDLREAQQGPRIFFFSAGPEANIVGATASLLLEVDEAQDVASEKFDRDLRPMASTSNATTVLYGTAWSDDTLLAQVRANNLELQEQDGIRRHFEYDWRTLAAINPHYKRFVENEMRRLGEDHISIRTQYRLLSISGAGFLLNEMQRYLLQGQHAWLEEPDDQEGVYIAGMDVGGEDRAKRGQAMQPQQDSTVITIARVEYNDLLLPVVRVVHQYWWTGLPYQEQYAQAVAVCQRWGVRRLVVDKTGLGDMMASLLVSRLGDERVKAYHFSRPSKSALTYQFLSLVNSGRLKFYTSEHAPEQIYQECMKQLRLARYRIPAENVLDMYVDPAEGHDDFLISLALCGEAGRDWTAPDVGTEIIKPRRLYDDGAY